MRSNNPVFNNSPEFSGRGAAAYPAYPQAGQQTYADPSTWGTGTPGAPVTAERPLTIDDVVQKTAISLGVVVLAAAATWILTGEMNQENAARLGAVTMVGMGVGFVLGLIATFKRSMLSPGLVLAYAAAQGVFMGGISKTYQAIYQNNIVVTAVFGTIFAVGGVLAAYKFFDIKIGDRFRKGVIAFSFGFLGLAVMELVLSAFGAGIGLFGNGGLGLLFALAGLVLGIVGLLLDFDMVENGIRAGVSARFAWTAAFGLTASIVMVYFYLLRLLSILNQD